MFEDVLSGLASAAQTLYAQASSLAVPAAFFLLLAVVVHRRNLGRMLGKVSLSSWKVNLLTYAVDALLIVGPLVFLMRQVSDSIARQGLTLVAPARFDALSPLLVALLAIFIGDAIGYFRHRVEHSRLLWPAHALHHSDAAMSWFTLFRLHPLNRVSTTLIDTGLLLAIGFPGWAIVLNGWVRHYYGMLIHADLPWTYGIFGRVLVSPAMHRWHHVLEGKGVGSNFATVFSVFDQCFRTYYVPGPCDQPLGVKDVRSDSYLAQLVYPAAVLWRYVESAWRARPWAGRRAGSG